MLRNIIVEVLSPDGRVERIRNETLSAEQVDSLQWCASEINRLAGYERQRVLVLS